jgi:hypothetical protein
MDRLKGALLRDNQTNCRCEWIGLNTCTPLLHYRRSAGVTLTPINIPEKFDKRDNLYRENLSKREFPCCLT